MSPIVTFEADPSVMSLPMPRHFMSPFSRIAVCAEFLGYPAAPCQWTSCKPCGARSPRRGFSGRDERKLARWERFHKCPAATEAAEPTPASA